MPLKETGWDLEAVYQELSYQNRISSISKDNRF
jgi:hypothetical protein